MFGVVIGFFMLDLVITRCSGADILTVDNFPDTEKLDGQSQNRQRVRQWTLGFSKLTTYFFLNSLKFICGFEN